MSNIMTETDPKPREFTGKHMLIIMVLFFGTILSVNLFMASSAFRSWTGLVVENTYVASQNFNEEVAAANAQAQLGWSVDLSYDGTKLNFGLADAEGAPLTASNVTIELTRQVGGWEDRTLTLAADGEAYSVVEPIAAGVWNVVIDASIEGREAPFHYRARLIVEE